MSVVICRRVEGNFYISYVGDYSHESDAKLYMFSYSFPWLYYVCFTCCVFCGMSIVPVLLFC
jgi:hypothetical protein